MITPELDVSRVELVAKLPIITPSAAENSKKMETEFVITRSLSHVELLVYQVSTVSAEN